MIYGVEFGDDDVEQFQTVELAVSRIDVGVIFHEIRNGGEHDGHV